MVSDEWCGELRGLSRILGGEVVAVQKGTVGGRRGPKTSPA